MTTTDWRHGTCYNCGMGASHPPSERLLLTRHGLRLWRGGVLRWRLETFGLYMPSLPNRRPWWRPNGRVALALLRHRRAYRDWLLEMQRLHAGGAAAWWHARLGVSSAGWHAAIDDLNRNDLTEPPR